MARAAWGWEAADLGGLRGDEEAVTGGTILPRGGYQGINDWDAIKAGATNSER